jgi:hypothetical protein
MDNWLDTLPKAFRPSALLDIPQFVLWPAIGVAMLLVAYLMWDGVRARRLVKAMEHERRRARSQWKLVRAVQPERKPLISDDWMPEWYRQELRVASLQRTRKGGKSKTWAGVNGHGTNGSKRSSHAKSRWRGPKRRPRPHDLQPLVLPDVPTHGTVVVLNGDSAEPTAAPEAIKTGTGSLTRTWG